MKTTNFDFESYFGGKNDQYEHEFKTSTGRRVIAQQCTFNKANTILFKDYETKKPIQKASFVISGAKRGEADTIITTDKSGFLDLSSLIKQNTHLIPSQAKQAVHVIKTTPKATPVVHVIKPVNRVQAYKEHREAQKKVKTSVLDIIKSRLLKSGTLPYKEHRALKNSINRVAPLKEIFKNARKNKS